MNIAIIGAGKVGGALAGSTVRAGHTVTLSAKNPTHAEASAFKLIGPTPEKEPS